VIDLSPGARGDRRRFLGWLVRSGVAAFVLPGWAARALGEAAGFTPGPGEGPVDPYPETARAWRAMGTLREVRVPDLPPASAREAIASVRARVESLEDAMTLFRPGSPLVALNRSRPGAWLPLPPDLADALATAGEAARRTAGAFDPTVAPAMRAWGLYELRGREPKPQFLRAWRRRPGMDAVEVDAANRRARRLDPRPGLDLGGVGKGIAVDAALDILARAGSRAALVNLGGSIGVLGPPPHAPEGWPVGIAHPRRPGEIWTRFPLSAGHLATSGDYERWVRTPAGRVHHLLDPATALPAPGVASLTAWAESGMNADLASTALFVETGRGLVPDGSFLALLERDGELEVRRASGFPAAG
jgi:thiamine biosynthesis lipoprotein